MTELVNKWDTHTVGRRKSSVARIYINGVMIAVCDIEKCSTLHLVHNIIVWGGLTLTTLWFHRVAIDDILISTKVKYMQIIRQINYRYIRRSYM